MENTQTRNYIWIYILTGILALLGIVGLVRGDWVSGGYVLGALGLVVWIYGTKRRNRRTVLAGLFLAGAGVGILLYDMLRDVLS